MRTASEKLGISETPDFFGPQTLGRLLGVAERKAYEIAKSPGFPAKRIGKKLIISKAIFLKWHDEHWGVK